MSLADQITQIRKLAAQGKTEAEIAAAVGVEMGDVATVLAGAAAGGPSGGGLRRTIACPFAYNTPNLRTGAVVYTPAIGDILHDAWVEIDTAWNGTTPLGDVGGFPGIAYGWFGALVGPLNMTRAANAGSIFDAQMFVAQGHYSLSVAALASFSSFASAYQADPARFVLANPVKVCVSTTGRTDGADPGSTQGAAVLYLDISTPQSA